jgi:membrane-bound serine protease (ClpP class)
MIPITEPITGKTHDAIRRKIAQAQVERSELIIFEMNTPGGASQAMDRIAQLIMDVRDIRTVAWVNTDAFSAGAVISLACDEIVMAPTGTIGDAMPIMIGGGQIQEIPEKERGKIESAMRSEIRVLAEQNGYNQALCEAMITITMRIWLIRHEETGELRIVQAGDWQRRVRGAPGATANTATTPRQDSPWVFVRELDGPDELVTLTAGEAEFVGLTQHIVADLNELRKLYNIAEGAIVTVEDNWSEQLVGFLTSPLVVSILVFVGMMAIYLEINTPGFGVAGGLAIACFAVLFGSRYLVGMAAWWEIALFVVGLILLALEVLVIPGFGIAGIAGIFCCVVGLFGILVNNPPDEIPWPQTNLDWSLFTDGLLALAIGFILAVAAMPIIGRYLPKTPLGHRLILSAPPAEPFNPASDRDAIHRVRIGDEGLVSSTCRPVGEVRIGDDLLDAVAEGVYIAAGTRVTVTRVEGNRVVITPVT